MDCPHRILETGYLYVLTQNSFQRITRRGARYLQVIQSSSDDCVAKRIGQDAVESAGSDRQVEIVSHNGFILSDPGQGSATLL